MTEIGYFTAEIDSGLNCTPTRVVWEFCWGPCQIRSRCWNSVGVHEFALSRRLRASTLDAGEQMNYAPITQRNTLRHGNLNSVGIGRRNTVAKTENQRGWCNRTQRPVLPGHQSPEQHFIVHRPWHGCMEVTTTPVFGKSSCSVGGVHALQALGHDIMGMHLNEGHCTFAMLEMLRQGWSRSLLAERTSSPHTRPYPRATIALIGDW